MYGQIKTLHRGSLNQSQYRQQPQFQAVQLLSEKPMYLRITHWGNQMPNARFAIYKASRVPKMYVLFPGKSHTKRADKPAPCSVFVMKSKAQSRCCGPTSTEKFSTPKFPTVKAFFSI